MRQKIYARVEDHPHLLRDMTTKSILNTDREGLKAYRQKKKDQERINTLENKVNNLENILLSMQAGQGDIKKLLQDLLEKAN
jgi:hypothetical protein